MTPTFLSVVLLAFLTGAACLQWSSGPQDNTVVYACANGTLSLPWTFDLSPGDTIMDIQWLFSGMSEELIATVVHGNFFSMPTFSGRVQQTTNAGIDIEHVQVMDRGNYSVEVVCRTAGGDVITLRRSAFVYVADDLQTSDGQLHVTQQSVAEYDKSTDQYHVVLRCGTFTYPTHPPFEVTWVTPSGLTVSSSSYQDGSFHLMLSNPVEGGSYTCRVPPASACLHGNTGEATVVVDKMEIRLMIVEADQSQLKNENNALKTRVSVLETENLALKEVARKQVSFHARMTSQTHLPTAGSRVVMGTVISNQGNAYNPTPGIFTAPYNGTYCFIVSTVAQTSHVYANVYLMVDNTSVSYAYTYGDSGGEAGGNQAVVHLVTGQTVWLKSHLNSYYYADATTFSGFLISADF